MWVDFTGLFLADLVLSFKDGYPEKMQLAGDKIVFGRRKQESGKWLVPDVLPGPFIVDCQNDNLGTLFCIEGTDSALSGLFGKNCELSVLNADYLLLLLTKNTKSVFPIYSIIPPQHLDNKECERYTNCALPTLIKNVRNFNGENSWTCKHGWVLLGNWPETEYVDKVVNLGEGITCWMDAINPDYHAWQEDFYNYQSKLSTFLEI